MNIIDFVPCSIYHITVNANPLKEVISSRDYSSLLMVSIKLAKTVRTLELSFLMTTIGAGKILLPQRE